MSLYALTFRWVKKRRHCLLTYACIISLLWLLFFCYYNFKTLSVSEKNLQHEFHSSKESRGGTGIGPHENRLHSDKSQSSRKNDSLKFMQNRRHITDRFKKSRHADTAQTSSLPAVHIHSMEVSKNDTQYSDFRESSTTRNLIPAWLRSDPSIGQLLGRRNSSLSLLKHKLMEDSQFISKPALKSVKPISLPLLASGHNPSGSFENDIRHVADRYKNVVLAVVDSGYINFAINFQRLSIDTTGLQNFLFVCTDRQAVDLLQQHGIACSFFHISASAQNVIMEYSLNNAASDFGTIGYIRKSNVKTAVILDVLKRGYAVLMIDPDVILFKNPFPYFNCTSCDVHFQMDREMYNSGFVFVRPTPASILLYKTAWNLYVKYHKAHDQAYINLAVEQLNGDRKRAPSVQIRTLPRSLFPCGVYYFEHQHRMFGNKPPCTDCVMVHNNYLGSVAAKIYRMKENLMWTVDEDDYYSNPSARFITYENPVYLGPNTTSFELEALKSALAIAEASGRVLILPSFHCCTGCVAGSRAGCSSPQFRCSLLSMLRISTFDRVFGSRYREHSFLSNSLVPNRVKHSLSNQPLFVNSSVLPEVWHSVDKNSVQVVNVANSSSGGTLSEVVRWISQHNETAVIRFHSVYGNSVDWASDAKLGLKLKHKFHVAFDCSEYEQWDRNMLNLAYMWPGKNSTEHRNYKLSPREFSYV